MNEKLEERVLAAPKVSAALKAARRLAVLSSLPAIEATSDDAPTPDWNALLMAASLLVDSEREISQTAVLQISHACLVATGTNDAQREAAVSNLERAGNRLAVRLAVSREEVEESAWTSEAPLAMDIIRTRLGLSISSATGEVLEVNRFQRDMWTEVRAQDWLSISAPTAAGKSFIVRKWIEDQLAESDEFRCVYVVPTRALIEEVARELQIQLGEVASVRTLPWDAEAGSEPKEVYVFTQERLHLLLNADPSLSFDLVFVDEAQKFGDDSRGVLLEQALGEVVRRSNATQVVFASPLSDNPEILLDAAPRNARSASLVGRTITVTQNLLWVNQVAGDTRSWQVELVEGDTTEAIGHVRLPARPTGVRKRLSLVAVAMGQAGASNVVYVNGAAEAEIVASQIFDALGESADVSDHPRVVALRELCQKTIHRDYALVEVLSRGVGFHYGNMPLLVRTEVENLFREGILQYLVCTSTLLEGVNLPCQSLFVMGPERGRSQKMEAADFWNLAGRAGRWGKEFAGNIVCIDTANRDKWPSPPRARARYPLARATEQVLADPSGLLSYIDAGTPPDADTDGKPLEAVFSLLASRRLQGRPIDELPGIDDPSSVQEALDRSLALIEIPSEIVERHAGISPVSMQRLVEDFRGREDLSVLAISLPESDDAVSTIRSAIGRIRRTLGGDFGNGPRQHGIAVLVVRWMRGVPLARLIADRIEFDSGRERPVKVATSIRTTMRDVETIARFEAPKYLACYLDLLRFEYRRRGQETELGDLPDLAMFLELGVSRTTEMSMISLGLSRTTAVALSEHIVEDELDPGGALNWLRRRETRSLGLPRLVEEEVLRLLERRPG